MGCSQSKGAADAVATQPPKSQVGTPAGASRSGGPQSTRVGEVPVTPNGDRTTDTSHSGNERNERSPHTPDSSDHGNASSGYHSDTAGYSTPTQSLDDSAHEKGTNRKSLKHSASKVGLNEMIDNKKEEGDLKNNMVHIEVPFGKPIEEVYEGVHDGPVLGSGISGLVRLATHRATGVKYAVKCLDLGFVDTEEGLQQLREEIYIMCQLDHPNIVRLEEVYESHSEIYLVQELCLGGELFDRLDEQPDYHYTEAQCARLVKQMLSSVRYIHSKGIIHRDLKLENFLFSDTSPNSELKMIDFGLSKHFKFGEVQHEAVGTPYTVAPEVIRGSYDERCDVWAIGVITYLLLSGDPPFGGCGGPEPLMQVRANILKGSFEFEPEDIWDNVSQQAKDFIGNLLVTDPNNRPTAKGAQKAPWLKEWANRDRTHHDNTLNPNVVKALVTFKEYSDMRKLLCEVLSFTLLPDQIQGLRREFEKMDSDGSGEISLTALKKVLMGNAAAGSLGALTEEEVEDIFNAMRVRKSETTIHWHEFIAAGLSQCKVDDRNLRLAFDRLDSDHKGYITFDNVMDLMGNDATQSEDAMRRMWGDSMKACNNHHARITYEDFLLLMKGQTRDGSPHDLEHHPSIRSVQPAGLDVVQEVEPDGEEDGMIISEDEHLLLPPKGKVLTLPSGDTVALPEGSMNEKLTGRSSMGSLASMEESVQSLPSVSAPRTSGSMSAPPTPLHLHRRYEEEISDEISLNAPLTMDDEVMDEMISAAADKSMARGLLNNDSGDVSLPPDGAPSPGAAPLTPPQSPKRGPADYVTPMSERRAVSPLGLPSSSLAPPLLPGQFQELQRRRSRSVDDQDRLAEEPQETKPMFAFDSRRAMLLPEHTHNHNEIESLIKDESKTPLVVNRKLYRAHRQMRLAVLEASKRFEDEQVRRARETLKAQKVAEGIKNGTHVGAGLVMRHGQELSSESIRKFLKMSQKETQTLVEKANRRGGRGRRSRKKTISDMTGMLTSPPPGEMLMDPVPSKTELKTVSSVPAPVPVPDVKRKNLDADHHLREPTTPGVFRKTTYDPFSFGRANAKGMENGGIDLPFQSSSVGKLAPRAVEGSALAQILSDKQGIDPPNRDIEKNSTHSIKGSASDTNLNAISEQGSPASFSSPATTCIDENRIKSAPSWPPPPPLEL